jgi:hypothetical protein
MNPNASPFQIRKRTYTAAFERAFYYNLDLAMIAPLAPIGDLTDAQKKQMQADPIGKHITYQDLLTLSTAMSAAAFVLE